MDEWDKIAEGLLPYDANFGGEWARLRREAVSAELHAAYLKGLEEGKSIADKSYFQIGVLKYPCTEVADAIQSRIDEAKGK